MVDLGCLDDGAKSTKSVEQILQSVSFEVQMKEGGGKSRRNMNKFSGFEDKLHCQLVSDSEREGTDLSTREDV